MAEFKAYKMDLLELTKIVIDRVQKLDPDNASKILGLILWNEPCEQEMIKLAFGPENTLLSKIDEIKKILGLYSTKNPSVSSQSQAALDQLLSTDQHPSMQNLGFVPQTYPDSIREGYSFRNQAQYLNLEEKMDSSSSVGNYYYYQDGSFDGSLSSRTSTRSPTLPEFPIKPCYFFYKGYCKHGANCSYYHGQSFPDGNSQASCSNINELQCEENVLSPMSLEKLEMEISDLLKSQGGAPVSISLLPMLYYEKYGRNLQADGYLSEGQRQGKPGFTLTKLLARFKNSIRLIDRPHGQHSIILAEDAPRYLECQPERGEPVATSTSTHRIYLTFPPDSTFTEDDVFNYFKQFGPVKDVRIPRLEQRMYGFVSFLYPETVCEILTKKNLHYICGSRVLAKPYKDKSRMVDKTYMGKNKPSVHYPHQYLDLAIPRKTDSSRITKLQLEEQQKMIELERRRLASFNLVQEPLDQQPYFCYGLDDSKLLKDPSDFPLQDHLGLTRDVPNTWLSSNIKTRNTSNNYSDKESSSSLVPRKTDSSRITKLQLEEQQKMIELERRRLASFNLVQEPLDQQPYFCYGLDDSKLLKDPSDFPLQDHLGLTRDVPNTWLSSNIKTRNTSNNYSDKESSSSLVPRKTDSSRITKLQLEEQQKMIELERRRLASFNLVQEPLDQQPYFCYGLDDSKLLKDSSDFPLQDHLGLARDVPNTWLSSNIKTRNTNTNYSDKESSSSLVPRKTDSSRITKLQLEEQQKMIELERRRLASFNLVQEPLDQQPYSCYGLDDSKLLKDPSDFPLQDHLGLARDVRNTWLSSNIKTRNTSNNYSDKESRHIELPENPFGSPPSV